MDLAPPDPVKLLDAWMEWERGETTPGRVMSNLKTAGLRTLLEELVSAAGDPGGRLPDADAAAAWKPTV